MTISEDQIAKMSRAEKVQLMEAIWIDLSRSDDAVESPVWHETLLRETEAKYSQGEEPVWDWEDAKRDLRKRVE